MDDTFEQISLNQEVVKEIFEKRKGHLNLSDDLLIKVNLRNPYPIVLYGMYITKFKTEKKQKIEMSMGAFSELIQFFTTNDFFTFRTGLILEHPSDVKEFPLVKTNDGISFTLRAYTKRSGKFLYMGIGSENEEKKKKTHIDIHFSTMYVLIESFRDAFNKTK